MDRVVGILVELRNQGSIVKRDEVRVRREVDVKSGEFGTLVGLIVLLPNLPSGDLVEFIYCQILFQFFGVLAENGPLDPHACPVHQLESQNLGELVAFLARELLVNNVCYPANYLPILQVHI